MKRTYFYYPKVPREITKKNKTGRVTILVHDMSTGPWSILTKYHQTIAKRYWADGAHRILSPKLTGINNSETKAVRDSILKR